ncbi:hypothetical protein DSOUD_3208 [Desulfuromonas soudanensis]|uniref:Uncharacterized protein n=1 Tax=Desulfuromonas soudanensis TaxID=1603606 RepID=A0A0M5IZQ7_9BACT|nr:hypothetical protein [Desulfuromonas soudanensis]ALC17931.1 hypothetical protein DSOUD_3208 [Desulfuromonas soudanensis]
MNLDPAKIAILRAQPVASPVPGELRRQDQVFFVAADLPILPTLETIFDSTCQKPADLFCLAFDNEAAFFRAEELLRQIKKNFRGFVLGRFKMPPSGVLIERAYAAGLDLLEIPLQGGISKERLEALDYACTVFPLWSVIGTLPAASRFGEDVETLAERGIVPLLSLDGLSGSSAENTLIPVFKHLVRTWRQRKVALKPLHPLLSVATPLVEPVRRRGIVGLLDKVDDARLHAASDLRRLLRVREVEASFESAGL